MILIRLVPFVAAVPLVIAGCSSHPAAPSQVPTGSQASHEAALADSSTTSPATAAPASSTAKGGRAAATGVIYVTDLNLYFDTFAAQDPLKMEGPFQLLQDTDGDGVGDTTQFGPGEPGYLGGRWWVDLNGNGTQDEGDHFFLCPLLGPGRTTP
jgi:hypothetical protein